MWSNVLYGEMKPTCPALCQADLLHEEDEEQHEHFWFSTVQERGCWWRCCIPWVGWTKSAVSQRCVLEVAWALHCVLLGPDDDDGDDDDRGGACWLVMVNLKCISVDLKWFFHIPEVVLSEVMKLKCKCLVLFCSKHWELFVVSCCSYICICWGTVSLLCLWVGC